MVTRSNTCTEPRENEILHYALCLSSNIVRKHALKHPQRSKNETPPMVPSTK